MPKGTLKVQLVKNDTYIPIEKAKVTITYTADLGTEEKQVTLISNADGTTEEIELNAPPKELSERPSDKAPYSTCDITIESDKFESVFIKGCQIYAERLAIQPANLREKSNMRAQEQTVNITPNTLNGNYPPKIPEDPNKPLPKPPSGFVVLPNPIVPEYVIVHAGSPNDNSAPDYKVPFKDYIKNVASCEIYSTWPEPTIRANIYCILSFTLNRIYTEWYKGKGKNFDITSSTAYDHYFIYGRNIFDNISNVVDDIFTSYIKRIGKKQPLLTQYCDGVRVKCPGWLTQWGSKDLGEQGMIPYNILKYFYGDDIEIKKAEVVKGSPRSYPGYQLTIGASGEPVKTIQIFLNRIGDAYPAIPKVPVDGYYGQDTAKAVTKFQEVFNLPKTGIVDFATWYRISDVYVGVTRIAELRGTVKEGFIEKEFIPPVSKLIMPGEVPTVSYYDDL